MPLDDDELDDLALEASAALQAIQNDIGRENKVIARVRFPTGYLRRAEQYRQSLPNVGTERQRRNASYALMHIDLDRWLLVRTTLFGAPLSLIVKHAIGLHGSICEWLLKTVTTGKKKSYKQRTADLVKSGMIDKDIKDALDRVWDIRCNSHLSKIDGLEHDMYTRDDYNKALRASLKLRNILIKKYGRAS